METQFTAILGNFETHLTLAIPPHRVEELATWSRERKLKCIHIVLRRGENSSQPMVTRWGRGTLENQLEAAHELARDCEKAGFQPVRLKLEVAPDTLGVPATQKEAISTSDCYFEHHIKLLLPVNQPLDELVEVAEKHGAHLSRNARRQRNDGKQERFVTGRSHGVGRSEAKAAFETLLQDLQKLPFPILETEEEFVVFDSHAALDAGWLSQTLGEIL